MRTQNSWWYWYSFGVVADQSIPTLSQLCRAGKWNEIFTCITCTLYLYTMYLHFALSRFYHEYITSKIVLLQGGRYVRSGQGLDEIAFGRDSTFQSDN